MTRKFTNDDSKHARRHKRKIGSDGHNNALRPSQTQSITAGLGKVGAARETAKGKRTFSFQTLSEDPIYRRIAAETCPADLARKIEDYGFANAADMAACRSVTVVKSRMERAGVREQVTDTEVRRLLHRSRREALRGYRLMRHALAVNDPMNQALRHMPTHAHRRDASQSTQEQAYAHPTSLQSNQSSAAYLRYLHRIATGQISGLGIFSIFEDNPFALTARRPDLAGLSLSQTNLKREVPTIKLVNEVLQAGISDFEMSEHLYPVSLPYDHTVTTARTALAALGGTRINDILLRTDQIKVETFADHRWAQDTAGLLGVLAPSDKSSTEGNMLRLISEDANETQGEVPATLHDLYNVTSPETACLTDTLSKALCLDAEGIAQMFGLYSLAQENGDPVEQGVFATAFLANDAPITVRATPDGKAIAMGGAALTAPDLRTFNYLARLHHGTGLGFHDLNTILALPGAAASVVQGGSPDFRPARRVTATGLRLLASYPLYRDAFDLTPAAFAALFGVISSFRRADQTIAGDASVPGLEQSEQSFMGSLFHEDAPDVHRLIDAGTTPIHDPDLSAIVARRFGLSSLELEGIVEALDDGFALSNGVDARGLAAIYRMVTLCRMLNWPIMSGLELMKQLGGGLGQEPSLWATLTKRNQTDVETEALSSAIEWLADLARWMDEAEVTPDGLRALLTAPTVGGTPATPEDIDWFDAVERAFAPVAVGTETFAGFETWRGGSVSPDGWFAHMTGDGLICDAAGVFLQSVTRHDIETACRTCLTRQGIDPEEAANAALMLSLVDRLAALLDGQIRAIETQVVALDAQISIASAASFLRWAQTGALDLLRVVLLGPNDSRALFCLADIRRHIAVVATFEMGDVDLAMLGETPHWIAPELADAEGAPQPLNLSQLIWLHRFANLQVAPATDASFQGYLALTNADVGGAGMTKDEQNSWGAGSLATLAILLDCPSEDMTVYANALIGPNEVVRTVAQIDLIARHVRLAEELKLSAKDLLALKRASTSQHSDDWTAAAAAAQAGLAQFDGGDHMVGFQHSLAERKRDALVPAYMQTRIKGHGALEHQITNSEQLYSYLLLDVNVTSAVPTSRIVEAISSLQLFISRALAGLEPGLSCTDEDGQGDRATLAAQWELDKDYRQWEANQKLLLYPQNYIEPELRQITSPEFDALQQSVSEGDVTQDTVEAAVNTYMQGLAAVCDLSLCSMHAERHPDGGETENTTYHLIAKAKWEPGRFFYRKLDADYETIADLPNDKSFLKAMDWTYWQEVNVPSTFELFSEITVCVFKNRYYFFWLELEERKVPTGANDTSGAHGSVWRLHPRYMRCERNALSGPMLTPGLFIHSVSVETLPMLSVDDAFEWTGSKPVLQGTYHPTHAEDGLVYGELQQFNRAATNDTLMASFGVDLPSASGDGIQRTALHIRLSDEWSDAILEWDGALVTNFGDVAPIGYTGVYPRPVGDFNAVSDMPTISMQPREFNEFYQQFEGENCTAWAVSPLGTTQSHVVFQPSSKHLGRLGTVACYFDLGREDLTVNLPTSAKRSGTTDNWSRTFVDLTFRLTTSQGKVFEERVLGTEIDAVAAVSDSALGPDYDYIAAYRNTDYKTFDIPQHWVFDGATSARLEVFADVRRDYKDIPIWYTPVGASKAISEQIYPMRAGEVEASRHLAEIILRPPADGKDSTGWVQTGQHGNRTFLHLTDKPSRKLEETFVVMNSSSVVSDLAKTMPRPEGCESLFTLDTHNGSVEDLAGFKADFQTTLQKLYASDDTSVPDAYWPSTTFDFDSAYGAYGWEIFYHIPSAIAAGYANGGQFDLALQWLQRIFDPQLPNPWQVVPLVNAMEPTDGLAFDTGDVIIDPDRIARDYPFYYQQATIRNTLEVLLDAGDAQYQTQTQESLQRAKAHYVSAKQLFMDNLSDTLESLTNTPWTDPTLGEAAQNAYEGFLPPYNSELRELYSTLEGRLFNLRNWLDLDGQPLNVPLLAQPIDPRALQRTAKNRLSLTSGGSAQETEFDSPLDFPYVLRSAKGYVNNLKLTSHRLQDASDKNGNAQMEEFRMDAAINKSNRAIDLQTFSVDVADMDVTIKRTKVAKSSISLANHVVRTLAKQAQIGAQTTKTAFATAKSASEKVKVGAQKIVSGLKSTLPNTFGFSNGGQNLEQAEQGYLLGGVLEFLYYWDAKDERNALQTAVTEATDLLRMTAELAAQVTLDSEELEKSLKVAAKEKAIRDELTIQQHVARGVRETWDNVVPGSAFYRPFRESLEALYAEEWATTQKFCKLLVRLYEDETQQSNGDMFLRTTSLAGDIDKFNAPHRLALDLEQLEMAYIQAVLDNASQTTELTFALSELPAVGSEQSALEELTTYGEAYFELTDEMFDVYYPGQYDRRIQSLNIRFPGLIDAGLSPHARLMQVSNTRFMAPDRDPKRRDTMRKDRHGLQSLVLGACETDTARLDAPDGVLKRFQNTGVDTCWHIVILAIKELKSGNTTRGHGRDWRAKVEKNHQDLKAHLTEVDFTVRFSGRWSGALMEKW